VAPATLLSNIEMAKTQEQKGNVNSCFSSAPEACESFGIGKQNSLQKIFFVVERHFPSLLNSRNGNPKEVDM